MKGNPKMLLPPEGERRVLLHSCCAPCSSSIMERMLTAGIEVTIFFYNPNIHPRDEYLIRKQENIRYAQKKGVPFVDADYDKESWFNRIKGMENDPERGSRCGVCFDIRFERTARYAAEHGFRVFTSSLGISRWKDLEQVNVSGRRAADRFDELVYWTYNWRKQGGSRRMYEIAKEERFYKQEYCGCLYSLRDTNLWRAQQGKPKIQRGTERYQ